jgi:ketosteroid isomerase-like protein
VSQENIKLWREWLRLFNARDIEALIARCDPAIEFHSVFAAVGGAVYHGHDGLRKWHRDLEEAWGADISLNIEAHFDLGEHTLTFFTYRARGRQSGADVTTPATTVANWRDGLVTYVKVYLDRADALKDVEVSEDELEPIDP